ncbi:MAG: ABC transporter transmembrane domain-containing protein, partial [Gemmatimonadota bacterium]
MFRSFRQIVDLHSDDERWKVGGILAAAACTGIIETSSVASIMPFMAVVANPELIQENEMLAWIGSVSGAESYSGFLLVLALLVLLILLLSHGFIALTTWLVAKFVWRKHHALSQRLLTRYLAQPYPFFLGRNTSELSEHLLREIETVVRGVLYPSMDVLVKGIISLLLVGFLAYVDPLLAIVVAIVLGGAYVGIWSVVREKQGEIGTQQLDANRKRFRVATEAFQGIKELKALGRESMILERYGNESRRFTRHSTQHELAARLPRNIMEVIAFGGVLLVVVYLLTARGGLGEALPVLAAFTFAGYKLMPALQGVFAGLVQVRFHAPALDAVHRDLFGEPGVILAEAEEEAESKRGMRGRRAGDPRRPAPTRRRWRGHVPGAP